MKSRKPIFAVKENAESEAKQMELLWGECGTAWKPETLQKYEKYEHWDKFKFVRPSQKRVRNKFEGERGWDDDSLSLLERMLDWDPQNRVSAKDALTHQYFSAGLGVLPPERLKVFTAVECARQTDVVKKHKRGAHPSWLTVFH